MVSGKYSALSGAITREQSIANISANLANITTVGYKKARMSFESMLRGVRQINDTNGINYNRVSGNYANFSQGPLKDTENPFDLAINGEGFFKIRGETNDLLTRKGNFVIDSDGQLVTDNGLPVLSTGNAQIFIPDGEATNIIVDKEGIITTVNSNGEKTEIGQLAIVDVDDRSLLKRESDTAYSLPAGTADFPSANFAVTQGRLEVSNVNMTDEMTSMIYENRLFQAYHDVLESYSRIGSKLEELGTLG